MQDLIEGVYDLSDHCRAVWRKVNPYKESPPTPDELDAIRAVLKAHYVATGEALAAHYITIYDDCGTYTLVLREGRKGRNFQTGEAIVIPPYYEVEFNAHPAMEDVIAAALAPPVPNVH